MPNLRFEASTDTKPLSWYLAQHGISPDVQCSAVKMIGPEHQRLGRQGHILAFVLDERGAPMAQLIAKTLLHVAGKAGYSVTPGSVIDTPPDGMADMGAWAGPDQPG